MDAKILLASPFLARVPKSPCLELYTYTENTLIQAREQKIIQKELEQKERSLRMRNRANQNNQIRIGRKLVNRSRPLNQQTKKLVNLIQDEDDRDAEYFTY